MTNPRRSSALAERGALSARLKMPIAQLLVSGILTWKVVPEPTSLSKVSEPWCFSTTIIRAIARP